MRCLDDVTLGVLSRQPFMSAYFNDPGAVEYPNQIRQPRGSGTEWLRLAHAWAHERYGKAST